MNSNKVPFVSVIIPMRNERQYIESCLRSVLNQDYPAECLEILVVNGTSNDGCDQIVLNLATSYTRPTIHLLHNPKRIQAAAMNIGIQAARGQIIIRVDAHTTIAPDYVTHCVGYLEAKRVDNVGGMMQPQGNSYVGQGVTLATTSPFGIGDSKFHYSKKEQYVDTVYLGAYRRQIFDKVGLYDETFYVNEDYEFNYRLRQAGGKILLSPAIKSVYTPRSSLLALWQQYFKYGRWKVRTLQKHPASLRWRQAVPPLFVGIFLVSLVLAFFFGGRLAGFLSW